MDGITLWNVPASEMRDLSVEDLSFVPGREGLRRLAIHLRREMPEGFYWDFCTLNEPIHRSSGLLGLPIFRKFRKQCGAKGCALGLARNIWPTFPTAGRRYPEDDDVDSEQSIEAEAFGMPVEDYKAIFWTNGDYGKPHEEVLPSDVADAIDEYLATGSPPRRITCGP